MSRQGEIAQSEVRVRLTSMLSTNQARPEGLVKDLSVNMLPKPNLSSMLTFSNGCIYPAEACPLQHADLALIALNCKTKVFQF